jgi:hypothetical protein
MREEVEHVRRDDLDRVPIDHGEERLQVMSDSPQRVRTSTTRDERQIRINQRFAQLVAGLTTRRRGTNKTRREAHRDMLPAPNETPRNST